MQVGLLRAELIIGIEDLRVVLDYPPTAVDVLQYVTDGRVTGINCRTAIRAVENLRLDRFPKRWG